MKSVETIIGCDEIGCEELTGFGESIGVGEGISGVGEGIIGTGAGEEYEGF